MKISRNGANAFAFHCFGICLFAKRNDHENGTERNWRGKNRTAERVSKIFKCTNNVFVNDSSEFAISCVTVVYCKYGKSSWATPFLYHSMCFVHWFVLSCLYTKITINTYIVCVTYNLCVRGWFVFCALVCLFPLFFFRSWLHSMECTTPLWMYGCMCVRLCKEYTFKYVYSRKI